jgi:hypothetical protein
VTPELVIVTTAVVPVAECTCARAGATPADSSAAMQAPAQAPKAILRCALAGIRIDRHMKARRPSRGLEWSSA